MKQEKGFTLIEILIAITIYATIMAIVTMTLSNLLNNSSSLLLKNRSFNQLQQAMLTLERDFIQAIPRSITNENEEEEASLSSPQPSNQFILSFSSLQSNHPFSRTQRSHIQRIGYQLKNNQLLRITWPVLDRIESSHDTRVLLDNIKSLEWEYLAHNKIFYHFWPPSHEGINALPMAVKMTLTYHDETRLEKLFLVTG